MHSCWLDNRPTRTVKTKSSGQSSAEARGAKLKICQTLRPFFTFSAAGARGYRFLAADQIVKFA